MIAPYHEWLAGLLIVSFTKRSGRPRPGDLQSIIAAESTFAVEEHRSVREPAAEPDPFDMRLSGKPTKPATKPVLTERDRQSRVSESSVEPPDVQPIKAADREASPSPMEETLILTDRVIVDSDGELARRLAALAWKVARDANSSELIQRVMLLQIEFFGPRTVGLQQEARERLHQP